MTRRTTTFGPRELAALGQVVPVARELIGHYFALTDDWFDTTSHRICTLRDLREAEVLGRGHLAQIRKVLRIREQAGPQAACRGLCPHYRICLQDHNLLRHAAAGSRLKELLTCVLTHEYVHLVRFQRFEHPYRAATDRRVAEEERVDRITGEILARLGYGKLREVAAQMAFPGIGGERGPPG